MKMPQMMCLAAVLVLCTAVPLASAQHASGPRVAYTSMLPRLLQEAADKIDKWDRTKDRETIANAYTSQGQDPTTASDAMTYDSSEASGSTYNGVYYNDGGKATLAGGMAKGQWVGAYSKNIPDNHYPNGIVAAVASNFDTEMSSQRGPMAIAGTYEGARATAGSSAWANLNTKDSLGGATLSTNIETYAPTSMPKTLVRDGDTPFGRRSFAYTNIAPNSAAQSLSGSGPAAVASGYEVASQARAARDRVTYRASVGHREPGENGIFETAPPPAPSGAPAPAAPAGSYAGNPRFDTLSQNGWGRRRAHRKLLQAYVSA